MKKILHVITSLGDGGAEGVMFRLISRSNKYNHVVVSLQDLGKYGEQLTNIGVKVYALNFYSVKHIYRAVLSLHRIFRIEKPNIVQTWMYHSDFLGGLVGKLNHVERIYWGLRNSSLDSSNSPWQTRFINKLNACLSFHIPDLIVCCANSVAQHHAKVGYKSNKMIVIENGFDLNRFKMINSNPLNKKKFVIGMVGRYDPQKDHDNFLRAIYNLANLSDAFTVCIVGRGIDCPEMHSLLTKYDLGALVTLSDARSDIELLYQSFDLHVLSSAFGEGFPNVVAEAMACGVPCVATDVGESKNIIGNFGWVVPPQNSKELTGAIYSALTFFKGNPVEWNKLQLSCRDRVLNKFSIELMITGFSSLWEGNLEPLCVE